MPRLELLLSITMKTINAVSLFILVSLLATTGFVWWTIVSDLHPVIRTISLDAKKRSELVIDGRIAALINATPDNQTLENVESALSGGSTYIDIGIITEPKAASFGGFEALLTKFSFGAIVCDGRDALSNGPDDLAWIRLIGIIASKHIPLITAGAGDIIRFGAIGFEIVAPSQDAAQSADIDQAALVIRISRYSR